MFQGIRALFDHRPVLFSPAIKGPFFFFFFLPVCLMNNDERAEWDGRRQTDGDRYRISERRSVTETGWDRDIMREFDIKP